jgi:GDPmannose 4,6-dehydratase
MNKKSCIITGISGQDGSYLVEQLLARDYQVYGLLHRSSQHSLGSSDHLKNEPFFEVVEGDLLDLSNLGRLCKLARPNKFFNCAAQSHVGVSFEQPIYTAQVDALGVLNCLEAIRGSGIFTRFCQASTSEMFGGMSEQSCNEQTPFHPRSPYGVSKVFGFWATVNYRESYKMFACNSICYNHEGPRRGSDFVTRKITMAVAKIKKGLQQKLFLGNLDSKRDWGFAGDYTRGMIAILDAAEPDDYVLSTGETHSVREFCDLAFKHVGLDYKDHVEIDPRFYRPAEVNVLVGDSSKIKDKLGWKPEITFRQLVTMMVDHDMSLLKD